MTQVQKLKFLPPGRKFSKGDHCIFFSVSNQVKNEVYEIYIMYIVVQYVVVFSLWIMMLGIFLLLLQILTHVKFVFIEHVGMHLCAHKSTHIKSF